MTLCRTVGWSGLISFGGGAANVVVLYHFHRPLGLPGFDFGYLSVDLFFVLSGIVLGIKYSEAIEGGMSFAKFAWHRIRRLYPMAVIAAALIFVLNVLDMPEGKYLTAYREGVISVLFITPIPARFGLFNSFPANGPMWSLWAELASNVLWFWMLRVRRSFANVCLVLVMPVFLILAVTHGSMDAGARAGFRDLATGLIRALAWFGVGYFIAIKRPAPLASPVLLLIGLFLACAIYETHFLQDVLAGCVVVLSGTAFLAALMNQRPSGAVMKKACAWLGMVSYPIYIIHDPLGRLALGLHIRYGGNEALIHVFVFLVFGISITMLNEWAVHRLR